MKVTPEIRAALIEWDKQKRAIGTFKSQARKHGISSKTVQQFVYRARAIERAKP